MAQAKGGAAASAGSGLPSISTEASSICGAAIVPTQAVIWNPLITSPRRRTITWPSAQHKQPVRISATPVICPVSDGAPTMVTIPTSAMQVPASCRIVGSSFNMMAAIMVPNTTSDWTSRMAGVASIMANPLKTSPYCNVAEITAISVRLRQCPRGSGTNQTRTSAAIPKRIPISSSGGKCDRPSLASANPKPQVIGTSMAMRRWRGVMRFARSSRREAVRETAAPHPSPPR